MKVTGLITEYNPFHKGHKFHLESSVEACNSDITISIMSGNFVQRGEPAIIDKWERAGMAVLNGVDLVIELPLLYSLSSAEIFAKGAISILDKIGIVDNVFFGSESGDIINLNLIAETLLNEPKEFVEDLKISLSKGISYVKARESALSSYLKNDELVSIVKSSNNILAIEYLKALRKLNSTITPLTLKRHGSLYNDSQLSETFSSATSIRNHFMENGDLTTLSTHIPPSSLEIFENLIDTNYDFAFPEAIFNYVKHKIITDSVNYNNLYEIAEGIENKLIKEAFHSNNLSDYILSVKSKRYTYTKISRLLTQIFIGMDSLMLESLFDPSLLYCRVLAFNENGQIALKHMKKVSKIPIITKITNSNNNPLLKLDILGTKAYSTINKNVNPLDDFLKSPLIIK